MVLRVPRARTCLETVSDMWEIAASRGLHAPTYLGTFWTRAHNGAAWPRRRHLIGRLRKLGK
eukprot:11188588-Lingulodinium_polyedra.AAC.1